MSPRFLLEGICSGPGVCLDWFKISISIHHRTYGVNDSVKLLGLFGMDVVPRPLHVVDIDIGLWAILAYSLSRGVIHPGPHSVDDRDGHRGGEVRGQSGKHWTARPAILKLHVKERIFTPAHITQIVWI